MHDFVLAMGQTLVFLSTNWISHERRNILRLYLEEKREKKQQIHRASTYIAKLNDTLFILFLFYLWLSFDPWWNSKSQIYFCVFFSFFFWFSLHCESFTNVSLFVIFIPISEPSEGESKRNRQYKEEEEKRRIVCCFDSSSRSTASSKQEIRTNANLDAFVAQNRIFLRENKKR